MSLLSCFDHRQTWTARLELAGQLTCAAGCLPRDSTCGTREAGGAIAGIVGSVALATVQAEHLRHNAKYEVSADAGLACCACLTEAREHQAVHDISMRISGKVSEIAALHAMQKSAPEARRLLRRDSGRHSRSAGPQNLRSSARQGFGCPGADNLAPAWPPL